MDAAISIVYDNTTRTVQLIPDWGFASDLTLVCPTHCTQPKDSIKLQFPNSYVEGGVSARIHFGRVADFR